MDHQANNGSTSAIIDIGKSRTRYKHQDLLLLGFMHMPNSTAKEVAAEYHDWKYERYADAPKRATDLSSDKLRYLEQRNNRECRRSGKDAHTYRITQRGIDHLRSSCMLSTSIGAHHAVSSKSPLAAARDALS